MFRMYYTSSPLLAKDGNWFASSPLEDVIPPETKEVGSIGEATKCFDEFAEKAKATGLPAVLTAMKHPRCKARKPNGFDKAFADSRRFVNEDKAPRVLF